MLNGFGWTVLLGSPVLLLLASAGGYWMSRRALAPVDWIARAARKIEAQSLGERLPLSGAGDELDLLSSTLNAAFERLESTFRRITQFTADASHELRTPVSVIRTSAELALSRTRSEDEYRETLGRIHAESERTTQLIDDLLTLARADACADGMAREKVDLVACLDDACKDARVLAEAAGLHFCADLPAACPSVGDRQALRRLFIILLDNAVKYTQPGGQVGVKLSAERGAAVVEVHNTGLGIDPEDLPHIFERFHRTSKDRSRKTGGTGLGLSIAQSIAVMHAGCITAESEVGAGSVFRVRLPLQV